MDGGVRRGSDVMKALALGARAVLLGRPVPWALATGGEAAVVRMVELVRGELRDGDGAVRGDERGSDRAVDGGDGGRQEVAA